VRRALEASRRPPLYITADAPQPIGRRLPDDVHPPDLDRPRRDVAEHVVRGACDADGARPVADAPAGAVSRRRCGHGRIQVVCNAHQDTPADALSSLVGGTHAAGCLLLLVEIACRFLGLGSDIAPGHVA
jgi:hypothetical protein